MTTHPVQQAVARVAARATRWQRTSALCKALTLVLIALLATSLVDYALRIQDPGVRIILSLLTLAVAGLAAWRFLWPAWMSPWTPLHVARRIEDRWPELQSGVSSSLVFLDQSPEDPWAGSAALRRAVISRTEATLHRYDLDAILDSRALRRSVAWCLAVLLIAAGLAVWRPHDTWRSLQRAAIPWDPADWPRANHLAFVTPDAQGQIAVGSSVEFRVIDENGNLPRGVTLLVWYDGDSAGEIRRHEMEFRGGAMVRTLDDVKQSLRYRVVGGDHDRRQWRQLRVVDPPRIERMVLKVKPPEYTGWPIEATEGNARVLEDSMVGLVAHATQALRQATLVISHGSEQVSQQPLRLHDNGRRIELALNAENAWHVTSSSEYWLELVSKTGVESLDDQRWQVTVLPDRPPSITHRHPVPTEVISLADISLSLTAKDDLAIQSVQLRYSRSDQSQVGEAMIELYRQAETTDDVDATSDKEGSAPGDERMAAAQQPSARGHTGIASLGTESALSIEYAWKLSELAGLGPGTLLSMHVVAIDSKGQESSTGATRLRVLDEAQLLDGVAQQQSTLLGRVAELLRVQRELLGRTERSRAEWATQPSPGRSAVDRLQAIELNQRDIQSRLTTREDSILYQVRGLLQQLQTNGIAASEVGSRLERMEQALVALERDALEPLHRQLTAVMKQAQGASASAADIAAGLETVLGDQQQVVAALEQLVDDQAVWDTLRQFAREADGLLAEQRDLADQLQAARLEAAAEGVIASRLDLELESFARRQSDIARRLDKLRLNMNHVVSQPDEHDAEAVSRLDDALRIVEREAIGGRMRDTAGTIRAGQLGHATMEQHAIVQSMEQLADALNRRSRGGEKGLTQKLQEAQSELEAALEQLKGLREKSQALANERPIESPAGADEQRRLESLRRQRQELSQQTKDLADRLQRLTARSAAGATRQASQSMQQANEQQQQGDRAGAAESDAQAQQQLQQARDQLAQAAQQEQQRLRDRQMARLEQIVRGWQVQQQALLDDARRLAQLRTERSEWTAGQLESVESLGTQQRGLATEIATAMGALADSEVFALALRSGLHQMELAASFLEEAARGGSRAIDRPAETEAISCQETALKRLNQVLAALEPDPAADSPPDDAAQPSPRPDGESQPESPPASQADALRSIEELKLLKALQQDIAQRTLELDRAGPADGGLSPQQRQELEYLAEEQGELAKLAEQLVRRAQRAQEASAPSDRGHEDPMSATDADLEDALNRSLQQSLDEALQ